jgi:hypothetical protein
VRSESVDASADRSASNDANGETRPDGALCGAGNTCAQCAEQMCPAQACALCQDQNHVPCATGCTNILNCVIQNFPCGSSTDPICFSQCSTVINAQPGGASPRDWASSLIICGCY